MDDKIRARPPATTALWSHLIKTDMLSTGDATKPSTAPTHPVDKANTSARLLLSDTQAQFQKFSDVMQKNFSELTETKREMGQMKKMFEDDRDRLEKFILDSVQRSQTEVQKAVAKPAQADKLEDVLKQFAVTNTKLEGVDKRADALQAVFQSQAQTAHTLAASIEIRIGDLDKRVDTLSALVQAQTQLFQAHTEVLKTLQDQQATIVESLSPLRLLPSRFEDTSNSILKQLSSLGKRKRSKIDAETFSQEPESGVQPQRAVRTRFSGISSTTNLQNRMTSTASLLTCSKVPLTDGPTPPSVTAEPLPLPHDKTHSTRGRGQDTGHAAHQSNVYMSAPGGIRDLTLRNGRRFIPIIDEEDDL